MAKTFKGYIPSAPVEFDLESPDGQNKLHVRCKKSVPGSRFLDFMARTQGERDWSGLAKAVREIFDAAIVDEQRVEFWSFCDNPDNGISIESLAEIAGWLSEQFAGERPLEPSGVSSAS